MNEIPRTTEWAGDVVLVDSADGNGPPLYTGRVRAEAPPMLVIHESRIYACLGRVTGGSSTPLAYVYHPASVAKLETV